ncbi:MAG: nucleotidyltransferase family protein, partial [Myxococcota bacterium]|nr:nucleotidyltransferase family protein [Myxococcota bacterium]
MACHDREARLDVIREAGAEIATDWIAFALDNEVGPIVAHALLEAFGEALPNHDGCREILDASQRRMDTLMDALDAVASRLAPEGIRMVGLKNAGIARGIFPHRALCPMGDLDVLVARDRFRDA